MGRKQIVAGAVLAGKIGIAVALVAAAAVFVWHISAYHTRTAYDADRRAQEYAESADSRIENACVDAEPAAVVGCVAEQIAATREDQRSEYDLSAQNRMANWAFWTMIAGVFTTGLTAVALWFIRGTLKATRDAVEDTSKATQAMLAANVIAKAAAEAAVTQAEVAKDAQRPWVQLTLTDLKLEVHDPDFVQAEVTIVIKNTGQQPTKIEWLPQVRVAFVRNSNRGAGRISRDLVASVEAYPEGDRWGAHLPVFPGDPVTLDDWSAITLPPYAVPEEEAHPGFFILIAASVRYAIPGGEGRSRCIYRIENADGSPLVPFNRRRDDLRLIWIGPGSHIE